MLKLAFAKLVCVHRESLMMMRGRRKEGRKKVCCLLLLFWLFAKLESPVAETWEDMADCPIGMERAVFGASCAILGTIVP